MLTSGAVKYGAYNWKRGRKDFFLDAWNHAFVHLQKFKEGDRSEDHLAHLACNLAFMIWAVKNSVGSQDDLCRPDRLLTHGLRTASFVSTSRSY